MDREAPTGNTPVLVTERLTLRPLSEADAEDLRRISNEPDVRRYLWDDEPVSGATIRDLVARSRSMFSEENIGLFGVRVGGGEDLLGFCGFVRLGGMDEPELGYMLTRGAWGRGFATEAAEVCLRYAFDRAGLERVIAGADAPNAASMRVIEKLGMRSVGNINAGAPDEPYFALYRKDFLARARKERIPVEVQEDVARADAESIREVDRQRSTGKEQQMQTTINKTTPERTGRDGVFRSSDWKVAKRVRHG